MPTSMLMRELVLNHPEFLALLDAVQARHVVGIDPASLFPPDEEERRTVLAQGKAALQQRGAWKNQGESQLTPTFEYLARAVAYPEVASMLVRNVTEIGPQLFLHYLAHGQAVEHSFPQDQVHRLALLPDIPTMIERARAILALEELPTTDAALEMSEEVFRIIKELAQQHQRERAEALLAQHGARAAEATKLAQALAHPTFTGSVAMLRCGYEAILDARSLFVLQGEGATWCAIQKIPGVPVLLVRSTNGSDLKRLLRQYYEELASTAGSGAGS
jgi:hypothetical protein